MAIQQNNGGPVGYGQPNRGMRRRLMREEDEQVFGGRSPEQEDVRLDASIGNGAPPNVYPPQPPGIPQGWGQRQGGMQNQGMPGRTPMNGAGENPYAQQAYQTRTNDPFVAGIRNTMATPMGGSFAGGWNQAAQQHGDRPTTQQAAQDPNWYDRLQKAGGRYPGVPPTYTGRDGMLRPQPVPFDGRDGQAEWDAEYNALPPGGVMNRQRPGTEGSVDPRFATPESGYGVGGVNNPAYQQPGFIDPNRNGGVNPTQPGDFQQNVQNSLAGFTDIAGMRDQFKPGQFMGQLEGFNTQSWGTGERGSDTLKNMAGTVFSNHDVTQPGALQRALVDIQKALPNASIVSHANEDLLDPDGPNGPLEPVDVIRGATAGGAGAGWQWAPVNEQGQGGGGLPGPQGPSNQAYNVAMGQIGSGGQQSQGGLAPQVQDPKSANDFLQWLLSQQQQPGALPQLF